jgi:hypothetical protein
MAPPSIGATAAAVVVAETVANLETMTHHNKKTRMHILLPKNQPYGES